MSASTAHSWRTSPILITAGFALSGMMTGGLMQADVPSYERSFGLNHENVSVWLSIFSVLTAVGGGLAGILSDRWGAGRIYRACMALSAVGLACFAMKLLPLVLAGFTAAGLGIGGLIVGNILVSQNDGGMPHRSLNRLHASHGAARLAGVVLSIFSVGISWDYSYGVVGLLFLALTLMYSPALSAAQNLAQNISSIKSEAASPQISLKWVSIGFFLYMIAEMVLITWLPAYYEQERGWTPAASRAIYGVFLFGIIAGRIAASYLWPIELTRRACAVLAVAHLLSIGLFMLRPEREWQIISLLVAGVCEGPGWPALFAFAIRRSKGCEGKATGVIYVVCCVAITVATIGSGFLAESAGLGSVFQVVAAAHAAFSVLLFFLLKQKFK